MAVVWELQSNRVTLEEDGRFRAHVLRGCACPDCPVKQHWKYLGDHFSREAAIQQAQRYQGVL